VSGILFYLAIAFVVSCGFGWCTRTSRRISPDADPPAHRSAQTELTWLP
jgi:hypothetical protein